MPMPAAQIYVVSPREMAGVAFQSDAACWRYDAHAPRLAARARLRVSVERKMLPYAR